MTKIYLAGTNGRPWLIDDNEEGPIVNRVRLLESFYYVQDWQTENVHNFKSFLLDSGAFTFAFGSKVTVNWDKYLRDYIEYINRNDIDLFFELDIDKIVGYEKVLDYRDVLERETGKRCIPVWHLPRGKQEWLDMCSEYGYVALGGLAAREFPNQERVIPWFTKTAHERGCAVHGLGYTRLTRLERTGFDTVDSSAWLYGNLSAFVYRYNNDGCKMQKIRVPDGKKLDSKAVAKHNFLQWVRLSEHMEGK